MQSLTVNLDFYLISHVCADHQVAVGGSSRVHSSRAAAFPQVLHWLRQSAHWWPGQPALCDPGRLRAFDLEFFTIRPLADYLELVDAQGTKVFQHFLNLIP